MPVEKNAPVQEESWEVVSTESATKVVFDTPADNTDGKPGDVFTGVKVGKAVIAMPNNSKGEPQDPFTQYQFRGWGEFPTAELFGINESYKLAALDKIPDGKLVRISYIKDVPVHGQPQDMKDFRVEMRGIPAADVKKYAEYLGH
jgi:hypothetical protein